MKELPASRPLFTRVPGSKPRQALPTAPFRMQQEKPLCAYVKCKDMTGRLYFV